MPAEVVSLPTQGAAQKFQRSILSSGGLYSPRGPKPPPGGGRTLSPPPPVPPPRGGGAYKFPGFGSRLGGGKGEGKPRCSNTPQDPGGVGGYLRSRVSPIIKKVMRNVPSLFGESCLATACIPHIY